MKLILQFIGAVLLTYASLDSEGSIQRKHHSKEDTIIMDNNDECYTQYVECMSKKPPFTNTKSTITTTTNLYKDKKIKNTKKLENPEQKNKKIHIPTKHNQSLRGSSFNSHSTTSPTDILHKRNALVNLHMEKQEAIHPEEVMYQSSAEPLAASNKHEETRFITHSKKGFLYISNIVKYIASIMKPIKTEDIQSHATDTSKKDDLKFTNILLSPEDPSNIIASPETNSVHIYSKSKKSKKTHHVQPTTLSSSNKVHPSTITTTETNTHAEPQHFPLPPSKLDPSQIIIPSNPISSKLPTKSNKSHKSNDPSIKSVKSKTHPILQHPSNK